MEKTIEELKTQIKEIKAANERDLIEVENLWRGKLESERTKTAKLVEALESARRYCESGNGRGGATWVDGEWYNEGDGTLYNDIVKALESNKKGGEND